VSHSRIRLLAIVPPELPAAERLRKLRGVELALGSDAATIARAAPEAEVILYSALAGGTPPFRDVWPHTGAALRWVHSFEAGVDRLLTPELAASAVTVTNARGVYTESLGEFAALGVLWFTKQARRLVEQQRARRWEKFEVDLARGRTAAVVGYGAVGRACARALRKLGMKIVPVGRAETAERATLHAILARTDVVLAAAPLTPATRHLLGAEAFAAMKRGAIVINVGRGPVVDEAALVEALRAGQVGGAALDVFESEPLGAEHPLWEMENVLLSPHATDRTRTPHWTDLGMRWFLANWSRYRRGLPLLAVVNKTAGY
jgi:phosphoglycerate dehydrogenase-like enzyme